jgi:leucine dehydrogenase
MLLALRAVASFHLAMDESAWWESEQVVVCSDRPSGLHAIIAIDDTTLGPGLGGVRLRAYPTFADGLRECRRLAAAMTRKNALAELPFGGAKSVIFRSGRIADRRALMRAFGRFVARTGGAYLPGVDMGTSVADLAEMARAGAVVSCGDADPSPTTAAGVHHAIRAAVARLDGARTLLGATVLVQGAGHVGAGLARRLAGDGAHVLIADVDLARARTLAAQIGATTIDPDAALTTRCDVLAPCAIARVITPEAIATLPARIVCGAANDTLADPGCADLLAERGVLYVPDFVANAGGVIDIHARRRGWDEGTLDAALARIGERVGEVLDDAQERGLTPLAAAELRAAQILGHPVHDPRALAA